MVCVAVPSFFLCIPGFTYVSQWARTLPGLRISFTDLYQVIALACEDRSEKVLHSVRASATKNGNARPVRAKGRIKTLTFAPVVGAPPVLLSQVFNQVSARAGVWFETRRFDTGLTGGLATLAARRLWFSSCGLKRCRCAMSAACSAAGVRRISANGAYRALAPVGFIRRLRRCSTSASGAKFLIKTAKFKVIHWPLLSSSFNSFCF